MEHRRGFRVYFIVSWTAVPDRDDSLDLEPYIMMKHVKIDFDRAGGVDLGRLGRSLLLHGERVGEGRYHVTGGEHDHWVDLYSTSHPRCDCGDHLWREQVCKHILAALLREGHTPVVDALGQLFREVMVDRARKAA
jgi:hypothetical protein